jgi:hypothetical protein
VLFQAINWTYAEYIRKKTGAYKVTTGFNNKGRIVNWGFAHFHTEEEREKASNGLKEMFNEGQILEKILMFNYGPPDCCYLCGQINHLAGEKQHKQQHCPLRKRPPPRNEEPEKRQQPQRSVNFAPWAQVNQQNKQVPPKKHEDDKRPNQENKSFQSNSSGHSQPLMQPQPQLKNSFAVLHTLENQESVEEEDKMSKKPEITHQENKWDFHSVKGTKTLTRSASSESLLKNSKKLKETKAKTRSR